MRLAMLRGNLLFDAVLLAVLFILMYAYFHQHNRPSADRSIKPTLPSRNLVLTDQHGRKQIPVLNTSRSIDTPIGLKLMPDLRSKDCKRNIYSTKEKASLVIDFNDYQFYDLKNTMQSILSQQHDQLLEEIIIVDDGSTLEYIRQDVERYLQTAPKTRLVRFKTQQGTLKARIAALREVRTDIVVFLEANVLCGRGWLEPLIDLLIKDPRKIALPHYDRIQSQVSLEYQRTSNDLVAAPTWNFGIKMRHSREKSNQENTQRYLYSSPAMRGNAFAVRKSFLDSIGSFDGNFEEGGGDILELSLRAWMCGGIIETTVCSRVGILNFDDPLKPLSLRNRQRIAHLWFGNLKDASLRLAGLSTAITDVDEAQIATRFKYIRSLNQCKDIHWFLQNVANERIIPTPNAVMFGILSVMTGRCARLANDSKIDLVECGDVKRIRKEEEVFELTITGNLRLYNKCVSTENSAYVMLRDCSGEDRKQLWTYREMELRNSWSNFCATHVTDPDTATPNRQIMMAQSCGTSSDRESFRQWQFISD